MHCVDASSAYFLDLKSVFMRGVCTLNFEAMQLLSGMPAGMPDLDAEIGNSGPAGVPEPPADTVDIRYFFDPGKGLGRPDFWGVVLSSIDADFCKYKLVLHNKHIKIHRSKRRIAEFDLC